MERMPEPELMTDIEQVDAYGKADFEEPHSNFLFLLQKYCPETQHLHSVLDLGSGAGDILLRFAKAFPISNIDAVDGSAAMLKFTERLLSSDPGVKERIKLIHSMIQDLSHSKSYDLIMSNSLLHHLHRPSELWDKIKELSRPGTYVFIMDLLRPDSTDEAKELVRVYAGDEPGILKRDFYNSLLAAYTIDEVREQLGEAGLGKLKVEQVSDRHFIVSGYSI